MTIPWTVKWRVTFSSPTVFFTMQEYCPSSLWNNVFTTRRKDVPLLKDTLCRSENVLQLTAPHRRLHSPRSCPCFCQMILGWGEPPGLHQNSVDCDSFTTCDPECRRTPPFLGPTMIVCESRFPQQDCFLGCLNSFKNMGFWNNLPTPLQLPRTIQCFLEPLKKNARTSTLKITLNTHTSYLMCLNIYNIC